MRDWPSVPPRDRSQIPDAIPTGHIPRDNAMTREEALQEIGGLVG